MYNEHWLRIEVEKWLIKKGWALTVALLTLAALVATALAAGLWVLLSAVLFPLAVRLTQWAVDAVEQAVLDNDWPTMALIPVEETWQKVALSALVWCSIAAAALLVWLVMSFVLFGLQSVLPLGWVAVVVVAGTSVLGVLCALKSDDEADDDSAGGIFLG